MTTLLLAFAVFFAAYVVNMFYITVLYHRGLAHGAVQLKPWMKWLVSVTGSWVTGIDPKAWACMHRLHHRYSDTVNDPHSPWNPGGIFGVALSQLHSYKKALRALIVGKRSYMSVVKDIDMPISWVNRKKLWYMPYVVHAALGVGLSLALGSWFIGSAYWLGMMSHPVQGWMVNALAHRYGYQSFQVGDESRNNTFVAWFVFGEGYQNNHHAHPQAVKFSMRPFEFDSGYVMARIAQALGVLDIPAGAMVTPSFEPERGGVVSAARSQRSEQASGAAMSSMSSSESL